MAPPRSSQGTSYHLQDVAVHIVDGNLSITWPQKDSSGIPFHHIPTSEDFGRPQLHQCIELWVLMFPLKENVYIVVRARGLSTFQTLCALSDNPSNPTYLSLGHFLIGEPLTQLPAIDKSNVTFNGFPGGNRTNNRYSSSGSANQLITSKPSFFKATCWDTGLSTTRTLCALSSNPLKQQLIPKQF